jgi:endonuclease/exonuclease/phosphatase (EEP) superfamily protein YafD
MPRAVEEISTVAATSGRAVPAGTGARDEVHVSTLSLTLSEHSHPVALATDANVSPEGRVAKRVGSL